jgi:hypothetical protein
MSEKDDLFRKLTERRRHLSLQLKNPAAAGFWNMVVDKYSDQAHFIYELIQNADDAGATYIRISLQHAGLIFIHNGTVHFSITDPDDEKDRNNIGHLNAITSIGASSKQQGNTIGKFGIGFKSVFQYTDSPYIEDDFFSFRIVDFIVPEAFSFPSERQSGETLFYIPFKNPQSAYPDIEEKLSSLHKPLLFLQSLEEIQWKSESGLSGGYKKSVIRSTHRTINELSLPEEWNFFQNENIYYSFILLEKKTGEESHQEYIHLFSQDIGVLYHQKEETAKGSIGFYANKEGTLRADILSEPAFCFFPTKEKTNLNMMIHAPFLLTDSRESIKFGEDWNKTLIDKLAMLAANSIECLCNPSFCNEKNLVNDNLFQIIPIDKNIFFKKEKGIWKDIHPFASFYERFRQKLKKAPIFLSLSDNYLSATNTRYASEKHISQLFSSEQLVQLTGKQEEEENEWCFYSLYISSNPERNEYVRRSLAYIHENQLIHSLITPQFVADYVSENFIKNQSVEWLQRFYLFLASHKELWSAPGAALRYKPFILCEDGSVKSPYTKDNDVVPRVYLSGGTESGFAAVNPELLTDEKCLRFFESLGLHHPGLLAEIEMIILPYYKEGKISVYDNEQLYTHLNRFVDGFAQFPFQDEKKKMFLHLFRDIPFLPVSDRDGNIRLQTPQATYFDIPVLRTYLENYPESYFLDKRVIEEGFLPEKRESLYEFLLALGVSSGLKIKTKKLEPLKKELIRLELSPKSLRKYDKGSQVIIDKEIEGFENYLENITQERSKAFVDLLIKAIQEQGSFMFGLSLEGEYLYIEKSKHNYTMESVRETSARQALFKTKWLYDTDGNRKSPADIGTSLNLSSVYEKKSSDLFFFLGISHDPTMDNLDEKQRRAVLLVHELEEKGISIEALESQLKNPLFIKSLKDQLKNN